MQKNESSSASKAFAYTPGLKVKRKTTIAKTRKLPLKGEVLVRVGDQVAYDTTIARAYTRGDPVIIDAASELQLEEPKELDYYLLKKQGETVEEGTVLARFKAFLGLVDRIVKSPINGTVESVSLITGQITIRANPVPVDIDAYIPGKITEIIPREGAVVETQGAFVQGIFGIGGETHGKLKMIDSSNGPLSIDQISAECKGKVIVGSSQVNLDALRKAASLGVSGVVVGGIKDEVLTKFVGQEIGVGITGEENVGLTLIVTEGFGEINMSKRAFDILRQFEGQVASINGATQIRAGVVRPEIVIPHNLEIEDRAETELSGGIVTGTPVRIIRKPYLGVIGKVTRLPIDLEKVETGSEVRVLCVELEDGREITVPRANVEIIEE